MKKHELLFLIFFALMTLAPVPVFYLFREQIGYKNTENKTESEFPTLSTQNYSTWPRRFEEWLSDTLPFKTQFIELYRGFQYRCGLDFIQSDVIRGREETLFYRKTVENYKGITRFTDEELHTAEQNLSGFFRQMEARGSSCLLYIAPDKEQVYGKFMPERIRRISDESRADQLAGYLSERVNYPVLYPKAALSELAADLPIYFSTDTHWNELGGYFASEQIRAAFTGESLSTEVPDYHYYDQHGKDLAGMLGLSESMIEKNSVLLDFDDGINTKKTGTIEHGTIQRYVSDAPSGKKLMIIGDSFSEYYLRSAIHDVSEIIFVTYGQLYRIDPIEEAPDYIVVMLVERNLPFLVSGFY